jgi:hypothetical protein
MLGLKLSIHILFSDKVFADRPYVYVVVALVELAYVYRYVPTYVLGLML